MDIFKNPDKRNGFIGTASFHGVLLILFLIFGFTYLDPPINDQAMSVELMYGTSETGSGSDTEAPATSEVSETVTESVNAPSPDPVITEANSEAMSVPEAPEKTPDPKPEAEPQPDPEPEPEPEPQLDPELAKLLKNAPTSAKPQAEGGGPDTKPGKKGKQEGSKTGNSMEGGPGGGNDFGYNLGGRKILSYPNVKDESQQTGTVVVDVIVDKRGKVVKATPGAKGSNTTSALLFKAAREAALTATFEPNPKVPEQKGTMTFRFVLN